MWSSFHVGNMSAPNVVMKKRRFFVGNVAALMILCTIVIVLGTIIQIRMTWSREHMRGMTAEAEDVITQIFSSFSKQTSQ